MTSMRHTRGASRDTHATHTRGASRDTHATHTRGASRDTHATHTRHTHAARHEAAVNAGAAWERARATVPIRLTGISTMSRLETACVLIASCRQ